MSFVSYDCAPLQMLCHQPSHTISPDKALFNRRTGFRDRGQNAPVGEQTASIDKDGDYESKEVRAGDEENVEDLAVTKGLIDLFNGGDEHETGKEDGEDGKCCAVEYAEEWDIGDVHSLSL